MDKRLQILNQLYEHEDANVDEIVKGDQSLAGEAQATEEMKRILDSRPKMLPDAGVIDAITERAAKEWKANNQSVGAPVRPLRSAAPHARVYMFRMAAAASAVFLVVAIGLWKINPAEINPAENAAPVLSQEKAAEADMPEARAFAESADRFDDADEEAARQLATASGLAAQADSIPSWSDSEDLMQMRRRVQTLRRASTSLNWDDSVVPLEMMPVGGSTSGLQRASATRNGNQ